MTLFKSRTTKTRLHKTRQMIWPGMGWIRYAKYVRHRLLRLQGSTRSIATGLSLGSSISFVPLPGTHIIGAALLSLLLGGNVLASTIGTLIGTPWTLPLMWWAAYKIGELSFYIFDLKIAEFPENFTWSHLVDEIVGHPFELLVPWVVGGIILMLSTFPVFFLVFYRLVQKSRLKYKKTGLRRGIS